MKQLETINPATGKKLHQYELLSSKNAKELLIKVLNAQQEWSETPFSLRRSLLEKLSVNLQKHKEEFAALITSEMGKPIAQSEAEIEKCAWLCDYYAAEGEGFLKERIIKTDARKSYVSFQPLGVILSIMPWNFPFWQVFRCAVPAIMAGNGLVLKHAPITTGCGFAMEKLFYDTGFPEHLFRQAVVNNAVAAELIGAKEIAGVSFTGSEAAGRVIASLAGQHLKKTVLELGGNDPYIVLEDADLDLTTENILASRMNNCGQVCIAAKRVIAVGAACDKLQAKLQQAMAKYKMGLPTAPKTQLGPMAREDLRDCLHQQVQASIAQGAKLLLGGKIPSGKGYYYPPTLLTGVKPHMIAFREELFGPVVVLIKAETEQEAITMANDSRFGLAGAVFTRDEDKGEAIARHFVRVGTCFVNGFVKSDPRLPFGGIKNSGYGRELSHEGILEFVNIKTVAVK